jgi:hypothetical protein
MASEDSKRQLIESATSLKSTQSTKKQKVTVTAKKLKSALLLKKDFKDIETLAGELETCFFDFENTHLEYFELVSSNDETLEQFKVVNGKTFEDYANEVQMTYDSAIQCYRTYTDEIDCSFRQIKRISKTLEDVKSMLSDSSQNNANVLGYIEDKLEPDLDQALSKLGKCEEHQGFIDLVVNSLDELKLQCVLSVSNTGQHSSVKSEESAVKNLVQNLLTDSSSDSANPVDQSPATLGSTVSSLEMSQQQPVSGLSSSVQFPSTTVANASIGSPSLPSVYYNPGVTSLGQPLSYPYNNVGSFSQVSQPVVCGSATYSNFGLQYSDALQTDTGVTVPSFSGYPSSITTQQALGSVPVVSFPQGNYGLPPAGVPNAASFPTPRRANDIHIKRSSLPEFSGHRRDWPEFKAVWRELAESAFTSKTALAHELKKAMKGPAKDRVKNVYITRPEAYDLMWARLSEYYDDSSASVQSALEGLAKLKPISEGDFKGLVHAIDEVEVAYAQLLELGQTETMTIREIDKICELLPSSTRMVWNRKFNDLEANDKLKPLNFFMKFLCTERASVVRLADTQKKKGEQTSHKSSSFSTAVNDTKSNMNSATGKPAMTAHKGKPSCAVHKDASKHKTSDCSEFKKLSLDEKYNVLRSVHACFKCFGYHRREQCKSKVFCDNCKKTNHLTLMCKQTGSDSASADSSKSAFSSSHSAKSPASGSLYAIFHTLVVNSGKLATIFCDNGSNSSYITHRAAKKLGAKVLDQYTLDVTTLGNVEAEYRTNSYELTLQTITGQNVSIVAFGMKEITSSVSFLNEDVLNNLFPDRNPSVLQRKSSQVDILLGCDYFGLHPKREVCRAGSHLSLMQGELGICLQGYHPDLAEHTVLSNGMIKVLHSSHLRTECHFINHFIDHPEFTRPESNAKIKCNTNALLSSSEAVILPFIQGEDLATEVHPKCGGCRCNKCPTVGHTYSFREQQELSMIRDNLRYDDDQHCWITKYPWLADPMDLPDNYETAFATLRSTETTLRKDPVWAAKYKEQIDDMVQRKVARTLTQEEISAWNGPKYYISHLAVKNPHSLSTPVRIVFNSSQVTKGVSLNSVLAKGPDAYLNNLLGLLLRWREGHTAIVGDIKKMFHSVHLEEPEMHCHRFLWRDLEQRNPDIYVMTRVKSSCCKESTFFVNTSENSL